MEARSEAEKIMEQDNCGYWLSIRSYYVEQECPNVGEHRRAEVVCSDLSGDSLLKLPKKEWRAMFRGHLAFSSDAVTKYISDFCRCRSWLLVFTANTWLHLTPMEHTIDTNTNQLHSTLKSPLFQCYSSQSSLYNISICMVSKNKA